MTEESKPEGLSKTEWIGGGCITAIVMLVLFAVAAFCLIALIG